MKIRAWTVPAVLVGREARLRPEARERCSEASTRLYPANAGIALVSAGRFRLRGNDGD